MENWRAKSDFRGGGGRRWEIGGGSRSNLFRFFSHFLTAYYHSSYFHPFGVVVNLCSHPVWTAATGPPLVVVMD